jgi:hypothetical protein
MLKKEKFMYRKETCTQRPRPEPDSKSSLIARAQQGEEAAFGSGIVDPEIGITRMKR